METLTEKLKEILFGYDIDAPNALRMEIIEAVKERDNFVIGGDAKYVPGNPLLGKLAPIKKENIDFENDIKMQQHKRAEESLY